MNEPADDYTLTECTSPAINAGVDLGADQPDLNGGAAPPPSYNGYNGVAPDMGANESSTSCGGYKIVKRAFLSSDGSPIADTSTLPKGTKVKYLIYTNNPGVAVSDISVRDVLEATFLYQGVAETGTSSLKVNNSTAACTLVDCTAGEETTIFNDVDATAVKTEGVDGDEVSITGVTIDAGDQNVANATVNIAANTVWALLFEVKMQ